MTKIKDLVTVTCDNLFSLFPIDDERYELIAAIGMYTANRMVGDNTIAASDERVKGAIERYRLTYKKMALCAIRIAYGRTRELSLLDVDRGNRFLATLGDVKWDLLSDLSFDEMADQFVTIMFVRLTIALVHLEGNCSSPPRTGGKPI
jgi:hypothetical protein